MKISMFFHIFAPHLLDPFMAAKGWDEENCRFSYAIGR